MGAAELAAVLDEATERAERAGTEWVRRRADLDTIGRGVGEAWTGVSGSAAVGRLGRIARSVEDLGARFHQVGQVLRSEGAAVVASLRHVERTAESGADQRTAEPPEISRHLRAEAGLREADRILAERLRAVLDHPSTAEVRPSAAPPSGRVREFVALVGAGDPEGLAAAWHAFSPGERRLVEQAVPHLGTADGLPATDRDRINRRALETHLEAHAEAGPTPGRGRADDDPAARRQHSLHEALVRDPGLMLLSWSEDGRGTVADGNPDIADHVHVQVPGTGASLEQIGTGMRRTGAVCDDVEGPCSSVLFQDFEPPADLLDAATAPMRQGLSAAGLGISDPFDEGIGELGETLDGFAAARDQHGNDDGRLLASGFSAGSRVVSGAAAEEGGIAADAIAVVGSPGLGRDPVDGMALAGPDGPTPVSRDEFASVYSVVDPITHVGTPLGYGVPADSVLNGGRREQVWDQSPWPWDFAGNHGRLLDDGSQANRILAELLRGE